MRTKRLVVVLAAVDPNSRVVLAVDGRVIARISMMAAIELRARLTAAIEKISQTLAAARPPTEPDSE